MRVVPILAGIGLTAAAGACAAAPPVTVFAAGDIADCRWSRPASSGAAGTAALIAERLPATPDAIVLTLGDTTYPVGLPAEYRDCYEPTWGAFRDRTRPTPGNHEYYNGSPAPYFDYFGAAAGARGLGYYSFEAGPWHVVSLNSHLSPADHARQLAWLREDLARHPARCTLAYWHVPLYSSGGHPPATNLRMQDAWRVLLAAGAELVLSGHDHDYERFAPMDAEGRPDARGIRQFVVGTGGAFLTPFRLGARGGEARQATDHGVLKLVLRDDGYDWEFLGVPRSWSEYPAPDVNDRGSATCH
ncbi:metallophosphoesterase family protein [Pseudoduganella plicata]|uniref:Alkaline phosphatase n=1 Tax=Pseudoduganella plicata TaxID=321984 RepID=A0A4P7BFM9_9BURK|nr:metallophosphoesterase [Pseudoduganella plicata]QBQ37022.1 alkaline phosphatase [Pseudoduganella plicata]GGY99991.1 hypothetical protein GCM10007388_37120 [Pseudoduganella plicata]